MSNPMTAKVLKCFEEISKVPRRSKEEQKICAWIMDWAKKRNFATKTIETPIPGSYNIIVKVPATKGYEKAPTIILQSHLDMVCEKTPESKHDFTKDPIQFVQQGEWLKANQTTLGADNGIGVALSLALAEEKGVEHPALELFFTVDEETGLSGANSLKPGILEGRILLNVDSEDEGRFTVGCAGGKNTQIRLPLSFTDAPKNMSSYEVKVGGLTGGHSGVDIHLQRGNAIWLLARVLDKLAFSKFLLIDIHGGSAHNAIPRDAVAQILIGAADVAKVQETVKNLETTIKAEYLKTDPKATISIAPCKVDAKKVVSVESSKKVVICLQSLSHGVAFMSVDIPTLVETSNNLATVSIKDQKLHIVTSQRSSVMTRLQALTERIENIAQLAGAEAQSGDGYCSWQPNMDSPILARCKEVYEKLTGRKPIVEVIHAGLECAVIGSKYPDMDMVSFGPTILSPHSPDERLKVNTVGEVWNFTVELLKSFKPPAL